MKPIEEVLIEAITFLEGDARRQALVLSSQADAYRQVLDRVKYEASLRNAEAIKGGKR